MAADRMRGTASRDEFRDDSRQDSPVTGPAARPGHPDRRPPDDHAHHDDHAYDDDHAHHDDHAYDDDHAHDDDHAYDDGRAGPALRVLAWATVVVVSVVLVRVLLVQSFVIPSGSMEPTLDVGDRVVVTRWTALTDRVRRGDVVVFDGRGVFEPDARPRTPLAAAGAAVARAFGAPVGESDYVKRVVGLPGERVACCDDAGRVTVDGRPLEEPYLYPGEPASAEPFDVVVPAGRLFVLGDHRSESGDSRAHLGDPGGGTVPLGKVVGRVDAVWWPFARAGGLAEAPAAAGGAP